MSYDPRDLPSAVLEFLTTRHLATLTTLRADGTPHVIPVGFTWDEQAGLARVITSGTSVKAANAGRAQARAAVCQVDGRAWLTLEGPVEVLTGPDDVREAELRYARRYRPPRENPRRVVLRIAVDRVLGSVPEPVTQPVTEPVTELVTGPVTELVNELVTRPTPQQPAEGGGR